jgi:hypothetical protein
MWRFDSPRPTNPKGVPHCAVLFLAGPYVRWCYCIFGFGTIQFVQTGEEHRGHDIARCMRRWGQSREVAGLTNDGSQDSQAPRRQTALARSSPRQVSLSGLGSLGRRPWAILPCSRNDLRVTPDFPWSEMCGKKDRCTLAELKILSR